MRAPFDLKKHILRQANSQKIWYNIRFNSNGQKLNSVEIVIYIT